MRGRLEIYNVANSAWIEIWNELCHSAYTYAVCFNDVSLEGKNKFIKP